MYLLSTVNATSVCSCESIKGQSDLGKTHYVHALTSVTKFVVALLSVFSMGVASA